MENYLQIAFVGHDISNRDFYASEILFCTSDFYARIFFPFSITKILQIIKCNLPNFAITIGFFASHISARVKIATKVSTN